MRSDNSTIRIGTLNVEYATKRWNRDQLAILNDEAADIWVLTDTHRNIDLSQTHTPIESTQRPTRRGKAATEGSTWVTLWTRFPCLRTIRVPDSRRMVATDLNTPYGPLAVAGVALPWHSDRGDGPTDPKPKNWVEHRRVIRTELPELLETMRRESEGGRMARAGDFNSQLASPYTFRYPYPP